jgi:hypothetical protein
VQRPVDERDQQLALPAGVDGRLGRDDLVPVMQGHGHGRGRGVESEQQHG